MSEYRTREQYWDYKDYLKHREGNCYYNKGLDLKDSNPTEAIKFFKCFDETIYVIGLKNMAIFSIIQNF